MSRRQSTCNRTDKELPIEQAVLLGLSWSMLGGLPGATIPALEAEQTISVLCSTQKTLKDLVQGKPTMYHTSLVPSMKSGRT